MAEGLPPPAPKESEKSPELPKFAPKDTLQARIVLGGEALNPDNKNVPNLEIRDFVDKQTVSDALIQRRSNEERKKLTEGVTVDAWKKSMVDHFKNTKVSSFFTESDQGKKFATQLNKTLGIDVTNLTTENATKLYIDFCADTDKGAIKYADVVTNSFASLSELEQNVAAFEWMGSILGVQTTEVLAQRMHLMKRAGETDEKQKLVEAVNKDQKINNPDKKESELLSFLYGNGKDLTITPARPTTPPSPGMPGSPAPEPGSGIPQPEPGAAADLSEKNSNPEQSQDIKDRFEKELTHPVDVSERMNRWKVENPPETIGKLSSDEIENLIPEHQMPFFTNIELTPDRRMKFKTNEEVVPHVWDLQDSEKTDEEKSRWPNPSDPRFSEAARKLSPDDSSMLALSAAAAPTPELQARVYKDISDIIVQVYQNRPELLREWLQAQNPPDLLNSLYVFSQFDSQREASGESPNYILLPKNVNGEVDIDQVINAWASRLDELTEAVNKGQFTQYHHRWIEMLSHGVDIQDVIQLIRRKGRGTPPPGGNPPSSDGSPRPPDGTPPPGGPAPDRAAPPPPAEGGLRGLLNRLIPGRRPVTPVPAAPASTPDTSASPLGTRADVLADIAGLQNRVNGNPPIEPPGGPRQLDQVDASIAGTEYGKLLSNVPIERFNNVSLEQLPDRTVTYKGVDYNVRSYEGDDIDLSVIVLPDKKQDAVGVSKTDDGKINIVVADGVTHMAIPELAARDVRDTVLTELENDIPSTDVIAAAYTKLQSYDAPQIAKKYVEAQLAYYKKRAKAKGLDVNNWAIGDNDVQSYNHYIDTVQKNIVNGNITATTLAMAQYDSRDNMLRVGLKGDSRVVIFYDGKDPFVMDTPKDSPQITYKGPGIPYNPREGENFHDVELLGGEIVAVMSDGIQKEWIPQIQEELQKRRDAGSIELDKDLSEIVKDILAANDPDDDVTFVAFRPTITTPAQIQSSPTTDPLTLNGTRTGTDDPMVDILAALPGVAPTVSAGSLAPNNPPQPPAASPPSDTDGENPGMWGPYSHEIPPSDYLAQNGATPVALGGQIAREGTQRETGPTPMRPIEASMAPPVIERRSTSSEYDATYKDGNNDRTVKLLHSGNPADNNLSTILNTVSLLGNGSLPLPLDAARQQVIDTKNARGDRDQRINLGDSVRLLSTVYDLEENPEKNIKEWKKASTIDESKQDLEQMLTDLGNSALSPLGVAIFGTDFNTRMIKRVTDNLYMISDPRLNGVRFFNREKLREMLADGIQKQLSTNNVVYFLRPKPTVTPSSPPLAPLPPVSPQPEAAPSAVGQGASPITESPPAFSPYDYEQPPLDYIAQAEATPLPPASGPVRTDLVELSAPIAQPAAAEAIASPTEDEQAPLTAEQLEELRLSLNNQAETGLGNNPNYNSSRRGGRKERKPVKRGHSAGNNDN